MTEVTKSMTLGEHFEVFKLKLKGCVLSKTVWFNLLAFAALLLSESQAEIQAFLVENLGESHTHTFAMALTGINLWLRFRTSTSLAIKGGTTTDAGATAVVAVATEEAAKPALLVVNVADPAAVPVSVSLTPPPPDVGAEPLPVPEVDAAVPNDINSRP